MFLFKSVSTLGDLRNAPTPTSHVLTAPWKRVGYEDFCINKTGMFILALPHKPHRRIPSHTERLRPHRARLCHSRVQQKGAEWNTYQLQSV